MGSPKKRTRKAVWGRIWFHSRRSANFFVLARACLRAKGKREIWKCQKTLLAALDLKEQERGAHLIRWRWFHHQFPLVLSKGKHARLLTLFWRQHRPHTTENPDVAFQLLNSVMKFAPDRFLRTEFGFQTSHVLSKTSYRLFEFCYCLAFLLTFVEGFFKIDLLEKRQWWYFEWAELFQYMGAYFLANRDTWRRLKHTTMTTLFCRDPSAVSDWLLKARKNW